MAFKATIVFRPAPVPPVTTPPPPRSTKPTARAACRLRTPLDANWAPCRCDRLAEFAARMNRRLGQLRPELVVSSAFAIFPWSKENYLRDWPCWIREGYFDLVCPQIHRDDAASYRRELAKVLHAQIPPETRAAMPPGLLVATAAQSEVDRTLVAAMAAENRRQGLLGEVFFYDSALRNDPDFFRLLYRQP